MTTADKPCMTLAALAKIAAPINSGPRPNADGLVKLMVLIAQDAATMANTGRTLEMLETDARAVMYHILDGHNI